VDVELLLTDGVEARRQHPVKLAQNGKTAASAAAVILPGLRGHVPIRLAAAEHSDTSFIGSPAAVEFNSEAGGASAVPDPNPPHGRRLMSTGRLRVTGYFESFTW
jgi:hypothetical protein